jgi:hypothetical protein
LLGAGVVALVLAFQGVAALLVVAAQLVVNGVMFLFSFQALPGGRLLPVPELPIFGISPNIHRVHVDRCT